MGELLNFEHAVLDNNKRAEKMGAIGELTLEQLETAYLYFGGKCAYSGKEIDGKLSIEHIIPIMSGGHSLAFNCVPVINKYNSSKSGYHLLDWWKLQSGENGKGIYNPYRLLKLTNYMIKSLEAINTPDETVHILTENDIDKFLLKNKDLMDSSFDISGRKGAYRNISQIETYRRMEMTNEEYMAEMYYGLNNKFKLNIAIFFEEVLHELGQDIPKEVIDIAKDKINKIPNIYINNKRVFKKEMHEEDIEIREDIIKWAEKENIDNKYGVIGYMDFEVLKLQPDIGEFLDARKACALELLGANENDFNNVINKIPNILTNLELDKRVNDLVEGLKINTNKIEGKSSELYRYVTGKPDLLLSEDNMDILLQYAKNFDIDKRIFKKGIPINIILDNLELSIDVVKKAELGQDEKVTKRIIEKIINNTNGRMLREAFRNLKKIVKNSEPELKRKEIERDASRWFVCISEKYTALELFRGKRINQTKGLYKDMQFNEEGFMVGVNPNAYIVPKITRLANLKIDKESEGELIENIFLANRIRCGERADKLLKELAERIFNSNPEYSAEDIVQEASRWFVFLSEMSQINLDVMFDDEIKDKYMEITQKYYKDMKFNEKGEFIDFKIDELRGYAIGVDYMKIANSFLHSKGDNYLVKGKLIPKSEVQDILESELLKCKNKKEVKRVCIRILKGLSSKDR